MSVFLCCVFGYLGMWEKTIQVTLTDAVTQAPVSGALVMVSPAHQTQTPVTLMESSGGTYSAEGFKRKTTYQIRITHQDYETLAQNVQVDSSDLVVHFLMQPAEPSLYFTETPAPALDYLQQVKAAWATDDDNVEFRHKLNIPGDWMGGIQFAINKWSDWGDGRSALFDGFIKDGNYSLTVEARRKGSKKAASIEHRFQIHFVMPEILIDAQDIDWAKAQTAPDRAAFFHILADEFGNRCEVAERMYQAERQVLKLTIEPKKLHETFNLALADLDSKLILKLAETSFPKLLDRILVSKTIYDMVQLLGTDMVLIYRNGKTNRWAFNMLVSCWMEDACRRMSEHLKAIQQQNQVDLVLAIDTSGSMRDNDPKGIRKLAASMVVKRFVNRSLISIVDFDDNATVLVDGSHDAGKLESKIHGLDSQGGTNIGGAIQAAFDTLKKRPGGAKGMLLLTDGMGDYQGEAKLFTQEGWRIYTIGLAGQTNLDLLTAIAAQTGGAFFHAKSAGDLPRFFDVISASLMNQHYLLSEKSRINPGQTLSYPFLVDPTVDSIDYLLSWQGSDVDVVFTAPDGRQVPAAIEESTYEMGLIQQPMTGQWKADIIARDVPRSGEDFSFGVAAASTVFPAIDGLQGSYRPGEFVKFTVSIHDAQAMTGEVFFTDPSGRISTHQGVMEANGLAFSIPSPTRSGTCELIIETQSEIKGVGPVERALIRNVVLQGAPYVPGLGKVTRVEGSYVTVNLGRQVGVRPGIKVTVFADWRSKEISGEGHVIHVDRDRCTVDMINMRAKIPAAGMAAFLDPIDYKGD